MSPQYDAHLSVREVSKRYGEATVLQSVDFDIAHGECTALIGPNGAGKSTLFNVLGGSVQADGGSVLLDGQAILGLNASAVARAGVGRTFQTSAPYRSLTVLENVVLVESGSQSLWERFSSLWLSGTGTAMQVLADVGLDHLADQPCASLSYGDAKRLELALALIRDPSLLLMDEPTAGMAPSERAAFMELVRDRSQAKGMTVLFTEHDMETVFGFAERVLVLDRGNLIADDAPEAIRQSQTVQSLYLGHGNLGHGNLGHGNLTRA